MKFNLFKKKHSSTKKEDTYDFSKYIKWFWGLFGGGVLFVVLIFLFASWGWLGDMPDHTQLENPETNLASQVISSDGEILGKYYFDDNRTPIFYKDLCRDDNCKTTPLVNALMATEDIRFYEHSGVDSKGTLRAIAFLGTKGGASTITQQLAKQLFTKRVSRNIFERIIQKVKEMVIAIRLERQYTKEEIIAMYYNIYDFSNQADGIRSAARIYFGKEPKDLNIQQSAMLVGMFKNSSLYNPLRNPVGTKNRRNVVLKQMEKYNFITTAVKDSLQNTDLGINFTPESHKEGIATYFREHLRSFLKEWTADEKNLKPDGTKYDIYRDGLKIYTTIDSRMQQYAEDAVASHMPRLQAEFDNQNTPKRNKTTPFRGLKKKEIEALLKRSMKRSERWRHMKYDLDKAETEIIASFNKPVDMTIFSWKDGNVFEIDTTMTPMDSMRYYKKFLRPGFMAMDPNSGEIKAWVGGMNYSHFQYDMVKQGKRQVGSTFKPFLYATAIDRLQMSPCDSLSRGPYTIEAGKHNNLRAWTAKNSDGRYDGYQTLKQALASSTNTISARLIDMVSPEAVVEMVAKLGVEQEIEPYPAIALGSHEISVYEMVAAYSTFANKGVYTKPSIISRIEDKNGTVLYYHTPETKDVLSEETAYVTVKLMEGVVQGGSGARLRTTGADKWNPVYKEIVTGYPYELKNPIAGKTGTTQNQSDGWFMGMVPNLVAGAWVGGEDRATHFRSISYGQGASMALPIWGMFMKSCYADKTLNISTDPFVAPEELSIKVDCNEKETTARSDDMDLLGGF
mgnify:CR=1 FL=1